MSDNHYCGDCEECKERRRSAHALWSARALVATHCGHPDACISSTKGGTSHCRWCEEVAQLRAALAEQRAQHEVEAKALAAQGEELRQELTAALAKVAEQARLIEAMKAEWTEGDEPLPEDAQINAAHPLKTGDHATYAEAMRLVGAKRSKGALVELVNWLLVRLPLTETSAQAAARLAAERRADRMHSWLTRIRDEVRLAVAKGGLGSLTWMVDEALEGDRQAPLRPGPESEKPSDSGTAAKVEADRAEALAVACHPSGAIRATAQERLERLPPPEAMHGAADGQGGSDFPSFEEGQATIRLGQGRGVGRGEPVFTCKRCGKPFTWKASDADGLAVELRFEGGPCHLEGDPDCVPVPSLLAQTEDHL